MSNAATQAVNLPDWFKEENIIAASELQSSDVQLELVDRATADDQRADALSDKYRMVDYEFRLYSDVVATHIVSQVSGNTTPVTGGIIFFRSESTHRVSIVRKLVLDLAKQHHATILRFNGHHVHEINWTKRFGERTFPHKTGLEEYMNVVSDALASAKKAPGDPPKSDQTSGTKSPASPTLSSAYPLLDEQLVMYGIAGRKKFSAFIISMIHAFLDHALSLYEDLGEPRRIFIYLEDIEDIAEHSLGYENLLNLLQEVDKWHAKKGEEITIIMFASITSQAFDADSEMFYTRLSDHRETLARCGKRNCSMCSSTSVFETRLSAHLHSGFSPVMQVVNRDDNDHMTNDLHKEEICLQNIRRLGLACKSSRFTTKEQLEANDWDTLKSIRHLSEEILTTSDLEIILARLQGRSLAKSPLDLSDLRAILLDLYQLHRDLSSADASNEEGTKKPPVKVWNCDSVVDAISPLCNEEESALLTSCLINLETVTDEYENVVMDEDVKRDMRYMVMSQTITFEAPQHHLLASSSREGTLLYGPPGTGKTHICRSLAKSFGMNMLAVESSDLSSQSVGETEKVIKAAFTLSEKLSPCILFMDEVDALFYRRHSSDKAYRRSELSQFLQCMDGLRRSPKSPIVIVATNRPDDIDTAFLRRLPQKILIPLPNADRRGRIIKLHLSEADMEQPLSVEYLVGKTKGYSGSDLKNLCQRAARAWLMEKFALVTGDEKLVVKEPMKLTMEHMTKALALVKATVTESAMADLTKFAENFNPESLRQAQLEGLFNDDRLAHLYI